MRRIILFFLRGYRYVVSPLLGNHCRFHPSCSEYAIEAIDRHGALKGSGLAFKRIAGCHPWNAGGFDPVPENEQKHPH
ncbi:MAG: membrane protein insertion efficiency factor YidD [Arenicellales bacterium]|jgi:putative membrane protein insertion efficiency factor|nr:membrane protein insertion efficiency factor YidD [Acidiferrobacteraceae bacterium]MDP6123556.1 membrane protein insertion efficiency factor YidD [Arenicellales bacterium]MDP6288897.1 membrane protein insertion efficiency factor YidD [Arenicellales bacterium]MDP7155103.1 membrane protein insertion efficiency factor YidD [Arenicellales bacterium]MDP7283279.1 membrane protein insertion efficiency factor YidD [Arenicellales bacterium]